MDKDEHMWAPIISAVHGANDQKIREQIQEDGEDLKRAAQHLKQVHIKRRDLNLDWNLLWCIHS